MRLAAGVLFAGLAALALSSDECDDDTSCTDGVDTSVVFYTAWCSDAKTGLISCKLSFFLTWQRGL